MRRRKANFKPNPIFLIMPVLLIVLFISLFFFWQKKDKIIIAISNDNPKITILDFETKEVVNLTIHGDTQVNVSGNYGTLRIKNVWSFGQNEGKPGEIFVKTIAKNFHIPIYLYSEGDPNSFMSFLFKNNKTNINFLDRLRIYFFIKGAKNSDSTDIDLAKNLFIKKEKLADGELGYKIYENLLVRLYVYFNEKVFSDNSIKVYITDASGKPSVADGLGKTIEVLGGKVVAIDRVQKEDEDCKAGSSNKKILQIISSMYQCKTFVTKGSDDSLSIVIGSKFADRY